MVQEAQQVRPCCCNGGGGPFREGGTWTAELCGDTRCLTPCSASQSCPPCTGTVFFCDAYAASIGLPPWSQFDFNKCYRLQCCGGCQYSISGFIPSANDWEDGPCGVIYPWQNTVRLVGIFDLGDPLCSCDPPNVNVATSAGPDQWEGGIPCGSVATVTANWTSLSCDGGCPSTDPCVKPVGSLTGTWRLDGWPVMMNSNTSLCDQEQRNCVSCKQITGGPAIEEYLAHHQIGGQQCSDLFQTENPCADFNLPGGRACSATMSFALSLDPIPAALQNFQAALTLTRSCPNQNFPQGWTSLQVNPNTGNYEILIDGCTIVIDQCARTTSIVERINDLSASLGQQNCLPNVQASGSYGYLGVACVSGSCVGSIEPYAWAGPVYSLTGNQATYFAAPQFEYRATVTASVGNFTFLNTNLSPAACRCTGSQSGGAAATWSTAGGPPLELDVSVGFAALGVFTEVTATAPPCMIPPLLS